MRRLVSAVRPRYMHPLQIHTSRIRTIEQIVAGKYRVADFIITHDAGVEDVFAYVPDGHVV